MPSNLPSFKVNAIYPVDPTIYNLVTIWSPSQIQFAYAIGA